MMRNIMKDKRLRHLEIEREMDNFAHHEEDSSYTTWLFGITECTYCGGNGQDAPCAYPSEGKPGCIEVELQ